METERQADLGHPVRRALCLAEAATVEIEEIAYPGRCRALCEQIKRPIENQDA
jgi:hypothetical protein